MSVTITMYSRPADECRACWSTEKRMAHHKVKYTKVLLDGVTDREIADLPYASAPVVVVTDDKNEIVDHWGGFRESKIAEYRA